MTSLTANRHGRTTHPPEGDEVSTRQAAGLLGIHVRSVRRAIADGTLRAVKRGSAYFILVDDVVRYGAREALGLSARRGRGIPQPNTLAGELQPWPRTSLVGRTIDIGTARTLLVNPEVRLLTLTGTGGIGKTRLALAIAEASRERFPDGVTFVDLAAISRPEHVLTALHQALGLREIAGHGSRQQLHAFLGDKRLLLVVDNFEHLLPAAAEIGTIPLVTSSVKILVTSRAPLRIDGEHVLPVSPLALPQPNEPVSVVRLLEADATRLFIERARAHDPDFRVDATTAPLIAELCAHLDGLPLAIELAASQVTLGSMHHLQNYLDLRLPHLTAPGGNDMPARHSTMRSTIDWSYQLLTPAEQCLVRWLATFAGSCALNAAEYAWRVGAPPVKALPLQAEGTEAGDAASVIDQLDALIDHGLLTRERGADHEPRFRMLETVREFGRELLAADAIEAAAMRAAHARYFAGLAQDVRPFINLQTSSSEIGWLAADDANLRLGLTWLDEQGPGADFVGMVAACCVYWYVLGRVSEARMWLSRALLKQDQATARDRARLLMARGEHLMVQGDYVAAERVLAACLPCIETAGDSFDRAVALFTYGVCLTFAGQAEEGEASLADALLAAEAIADPRLRAAVEAGSLANLSVTARSRGELALAESRSVSALRIQEQMGFDLAELRSLVDLGEIAREQENYHLAAERYLLCLERADWLGDKRLIADALTGLALVAAVWGQGLSALLLVGAADALREREGIGMTLPKDAISANDHLDMLRQTLGAEACAAALSEGRALPESDVRSLAAMVAAPPENLQPRLTRREQDVLRLLAAERSDREIAAELFIGVRTVHWHVRSVLSKLEARSRHHAVQRARAAGLV